jgi:CHAD domain-containing protein
VFGASAGARRLARALRRVRTLTRTLGPVRELDVTLELLAELAASRGDLALPARLVRRGVAAERARRRSRMLETLTPATVEDTDRAVERVLVRLGKTPDDSGWREELRTRTSDRARQLVDAVHDVGLLFDPVRLHQVRIAAKKLRYSLELAGESRVARTGRVVASLKDMQEHLGRLHDLQVLLVFARSPEIDAVPRHRAPLAALRDLVERECHREHARYLRRRERLVATADTAAELVSGPVGPANGSADMETHARPHAGGEVHGAW